MSDFDVGVFLNNSEEQPVGELGAGEDLQVDNEFQVARVNGNSDSQEAQVVVFDSDSESEVHNSSRVQVGSGIPLSPFLLRLSRAMERELGSRFNSSSNFEDFDSIDPDYESYLAGNLEYFDAVDSYFIDFLSSTSFLEYDDNDVGERNEIVDMGSHPAAAKSVVEGLPEVKIGKENSGSCCAVCNEEFEEGKKVKELPCLHRYHGDCIGPWLKIRNTCPLCRYELPTDDEEYERRRKRRRSQGVSAPAAGGGASG